ncbi:phage minor tail protein L [Orrella sp. 11846]|uniref:phage minor tail protein L n=1 Tax=Orrella sp. 11846 TaxID=3409913 RepID=UPI003B5B9899
MILEDVQKLVPGNLVTLYEIDCRAIGGDVERYHNHNDGEIVWQGHSYHPWAIEAKNFARTGEGQQPRPELTVGNIGVDDEGEPITGVVTALCLALDDLIGAKVTRKRTFAKYLDAANFPDGNPSADPNEHLPDEQWLVSRRKLETPQAVTFELTSPLQFDGARLPSRPVIAGVCGWLLIEAPFGGYRGAYCGYTGAQMFDEDGNPVTDPSLDRCGGRVSDCKKRFGEHNQLSYGSFPSADRFN